MKTIHKHNLRIDDEQILNLHQGFRLLSIKEVNGTPYIWVEVNTNEPKVEVLIHTVGTGHEITFDTARAQYIDTVVMFNGSLVFHFYWEIR